jgi:hypothetical protein
VIDLNGVLDREIECGKGRDGKKKEDRAGGSGSFHGWESVKWRWARKKRASSCPLSLPPWFVATGEDHWFFSFPFDVA